MSPPTQSDLRGAGKLGAVQERLHPRSAGRRAQHPARHTDRGRRGCAARRPARGGLRRGSRPGIARCARAARTRFSGRYHGRGGSSPGAAGRRGSLSSRRKHNCKREQHDVAEWVRHIAKRTHREPQASTFAPMQFPETWHRRLFECQSGALPWRTNLEALLRLRWVIDPRTPALSLEAPGCFLPGWRFAGILKPMGHGGLVAPFWKARHDAAMHARVHKGPHRRLVVPHCASPESMIDVAKDRDRKAPWRAFGLARRAKGLDQERRQIPPSPDPQARDGHEGH
jgi:hypothetical protein